MHSEMFTDSKLAEGPLGLHFGRLLTSRQYLETNPTHTYPMLVSHVQFFSWCFMGRAYVILRAKELMKYDSSQA